MIDGSHHSFEDNIALTKQVVEYAHAHGVVVEGELGTARRHRGRGQRLRRRRLTTPIPTQVEEFVTKTGRRLAGHRHRHQPRRVQVQARPEAAAPLRHSRGGQQTPARLPDRAARRFLALSPRIRQDHQPVRRQDARRHRHPRGHAAQGGLDGGLQDQHRLRPAPGDDGRHPPVLRRSIPTTSTRASTSSPRAAHIKELVKHKLVDVLGCNGKA